MADHIRIRKVPGVWTVRSGGAILGETSAALELSEEGYDPVIYFPRSDIAMAFLERTDKVTHCPHRGDAHHYSIITKSSVHENAAWTYEAPFEGMDEIAEYVAFHPSDSVTIEQI
ncbi:DUF427 domain-containing protein [Pseudodonghicola xiamenensis]|uniref:DUF427 domain-containing protein n=1 Tax=Pseudodonghicola xiamenensis TaxID=337702 RepID=A0A8J3MEB4_9RHOB|nr:DUF427 domain-containing protein [Pseudodonghicola xiamenensis]GHG95722.1 hypothetical protein GCM10010961_29640 [Pseudodonghicola xiamenensis]